MSMIKTVFGKVWEDREDYHGKYEAAGIGDLAWHNINTGNQRETASKGLSK